MLSKLRLPILTALLLAGATFAPAFAQDTAAPAAPPAEAAPAADAAPASAMPAGRVGAPSEGMGQIVFFRPSKLVGAAIGFKVREGETELGKLGNGNYFVLQVAPGKHTYVVHSEVKDELTIEVDAGETYYVVGGLSMGIVAGRPNLAPSTKEAFDALPKLKLSKLN